MDREDIIKLAREAGIDAVTSWKDPAPAVELIERFAALVAAAEKNRLADAIEKMPFGDTASSFATFVRNFK